MLPKIDPMKKSLADSTDMKRRWTKMHERKTPKNVSMTEIAPKYKNASWNRYSRLHDSFLEELSYKKQKCCNADVWHLNYI